MIFELLYKHFLATFVRSSVALAAKAAIHGHFVSLTSKIVIPLNDVDGQNITFPACATDLVFLKCRCCRSRYTQLGSNLRPLQCLCCESRKKKFNLKNSNYTPLVSYTTQTEVFATETLVNLSSYPPEKRNEFSSFSNDAHSGMLVSKPAAAIISSTAANSTSRIKLMASCVKWFDTNATFDFKRRSKVSRNTDRVGCQKNAFTSTKKAINEIQCFAAAIS